LNILITGGTGYLSTHTTIILQAENSCFLVDNLSVSSPVVLEHLTSITGEKIPFFNSDLFDISEITKILNNAHIDLVIHFAGLKNNSNPDIASYNFEMTKALIKAMSEAGVYKLIFASSAAVYGEAIDIRIKEDHFKCPVNNYGLAKLKTEHLLEELAVKHQEWSILSLRHFNVVGMHPSCLLGRNNADCSNNLIDNIIKAAVSSSALILDYGYETIDGTMLRDYVHVMDVAESHKYAIDFVNKQNGFNAINIGTGSATSALGLVQSFEKISNKRITVKASKKEISAVESCVANSSKCENILAWKPKHTLNEICQIEWKYQLGKTLCN